MSSYSLMPLVWFVAIIAMIPLALWLLKRTPIGAGQAQGMMRSVATLPISQNQRLVTVEVGQGDERRWLVLGVSAGSITTLHDMPAQAELPVDAACVAKRPPSRRCWRGCANREVRRDEPVSSLGCGRTHRCAALGIGCRCRCCRCWPRRRRAATTGTASLPLMVAQGAGGTSYSVPIQTLLFFTALSFLPALLLLMTGFTRIVIVLGLLRQAIGTQAAPPNQVVIGLSLFLTFFVMGPTIDKVYAEAYQPFAENRIAFDEALRRGEQPMRAFMLKQTRQSDVMLFANLAKIDSSVKSEDVPFKVLVPAFVTSELKSAFQIGFLIFIPFLIIDMIVASVLMSLGMMMLSPVLVALPFKLMLFVLADGWNLLLGSLAASFVT